MDQATDKRSPIIGGALILTVGFLALFVALLSVGKLPDGCTNGLWLIDRLSCLEPNALGDTFAGAFAPVAFVWLVAAVMLQRNELAAQRQELRESREVASQQVEEARRNVLFIEEQTAILRKTRSNQDFEDFDRDMDEYIELLRTSIKRNKNTHVIRTREAFQTSSSNFEHLPITLSVHPEIEPYDALNYCQAQLTNSITRFKKFYDGNADLVFYEMDFMQDAKGCILRIEEILPKVSAPKLFKVGMTNIQAFKDGFAFIDDLVARRPVE